MSLNLAEKQAVVAEVAAPGDGAPLAHAGDVGHEVVDGLGARGDGDGLGVLVFGQIHGREHRTVGVHPHGVRPGSG